VTQPTGATEAALIERTRDGDMDAYEELYRRHTTDAAKVARIVTNNNDEAQDVVSEAFTRVLRLLKTGGGPEDSLGPYLRTTIRRLAIDRHRSTQRTGPADPSTFDILPTAGDPMARATDRQLVRRAFETLPLRWQEVLWHTEIEGSAPASLASRLNTTPNAVAALAYRAREGLRQAYLSINLSTEVAAGCKPFAKGIPALVRGTLPAREAQPLLGHLGTCGTCRERRDEMFLLVSDLPAALAPALLLPVAAGTGIAAGAGAVGGGLLGWLSPSRWGSKPGRVVATSAAIAALAALAIAAILTLSNDSDDPPAAAPSSEPGGSAEPSGGSGQDEEPPKADPPDEDPPNEPPAVDDPTPTPPPAEPDPTDPPPDNPTDDPTDVPDPGPSDSPEPSPTADPGRAPRFDTHPQDATVRAGNEVTLSAEVSGSPKPRLQWQVRDSAGTAAATDQVTQIAQMAQTTVSSPTWTDLPGETGSQVTLVDLAPSSDGSGVRVVAENAHGSVNSESATLTVHYAPLIVTHPANAAAEFGQDIELHASATANPAVEAVTWQVRTGNGWTDVLDGPTSDSSTTLTIDNADFSDDANYRVIFQNEIGSTPTHASTLSVTATGTLRTKVHTGPISGKHTVKCVRPVDERVYLGSCDQGAWSLSADGALRWSNGNCLDVRGAHPHFATTQPCTGEQSQSWTLDPDNYGRQALRNLNDQCIYVKSRSWHDDALTAHPCFSGWNKRFVFEH
jgi:RNA polymerase sigma factor (sigma-70 family)